MNFRIGMLLFFLCVFAACDKDDCEEMVEEEETVVVQNCTDYILNDQETDIDCGGPSCPPCANDEFGFLTYFVDGVFYESRFTSLAANRIPGATPAPLEDEMTFSGGSGHSIAFYLQDDGLAPMSWGPSDSPEYLINNGSPTPNTCALIDNEGVMYQAEIDPIGIALNFTTLEYNGPALVPPGSPGGLIEGTFSGTMFSDSLETTVTITDGQFLLFFLD